MNTIVFLMSYMSGLIKVVRFYLSLCNFGRLAAAGL